MQSCEDHQIEAVTCALRACGAVRGALQGYTTMYCSVIGCSASEQAHTLDTGLVRNPAQGPLALLHPSAYTTLRHDCCFGVLVVARIGCSYGFCFSLSVQPFDQ